MRLRACALAVAGLAAAAQAAAAPPPSRTRPVPILMYHVLGRPPAGVGYPGLYVAPTRFRAQVALLAQHGYTAVTLGQVWQAWHGTGALPRKPVVFSFDDGYRSDAAVALPVLRKHGWVGVLNLELRNLQPVWGARPGEVRRLIAAGWEIDAHTLTHPDLTTVSAEEAWRQINGSRVAIRLRFHVPVDFFAYPSGRYDASVEAAVRRAGFSAATTTAYGIARPQDDPYALPRVRVDAGESAPALLTALDGLAGR